MNRSRPLPPEMDEAVSDTSYSYTFTVFTPTYNRAHTLHRVYQSLEAQTFRDFEWLVVDDGSTDHTGSLVSNWMREADFPIRYIWQKNSGKGSAINRGVREARGELFLILDSDDACLPNALERFKWHWESIPLPERNGFSAVTCLVQHPDGTLSGSRFPSDPTDSDPLEIRFKHGVTGEKWGFHRTDVLARFPFPEIPGEKFIAESYVWNQIALEYKTRYVNEPLRIYFPSENSLSSPAVRVRNPQGARLYYLEFVNRDYPTPPKHRLRAYVNYVRFSMHAGIELPEQYRSVRSFFHWCLAFPLGMLLYLRDRRRVSTKD